MRSRNRSTFGVPDVLGRVLAARGVVLDDAEAF